MSSSEEQPSRGPTGILVEPAGGAGPPAAHPGASSNPIAHQYALPKHGIDTAKAELEGGQMEQGQHPGDKYVRRIRSSDAGFRRLGPGHLEALPQTLTPGTAVGRGFGALKRLVIGNPLSTAAAQHERLNEAQALAVLSSDALSSVAYATEAVLGALLVAGTGAFGWNVGISLAIATLIGILVFSYRQTIHAYPNGGGSYIVARANLGTIPGLIAAAALLIDYVLTVAVSISAGVLALYSLAPQLAPYRVQICLGAIVVLLILNLRGLRESGTVLALPTFGFLIMVYGMLSFGLFQFFTGQLGTAGPGRDLIPPGDPLTHSLHTVGILLILTAFSSGCTALTGIEAISNGVPAFRAPEARNAGRTMVALGLLLGSMFLGISFLADQVGVHLSTTESVLSQVGRTVFRPLDGLRIGDQNAFWVLLQWATACILVLAANTSFADFPRLSYLLARDRFLPHLFALRGDRLAFTMGIGALAALAGVLIWMFNGDTTALLPLYAIGVFTSFTLSQTGMVVHWWRGRAPGWRRSAAVNGVGALTTCIVLVILCWTKFGEGQPLLLLGSFTVNEGAWIVIVLIPLLVALLLRIHRHYERVRDALSLAGVDPQAGRAAAAGAIVAANPLINLLLGPGPDGESRSAPGVHRIEHLVLMPIAGLNQVTLATLAYARSLTPDVVAVHVAADEEIEQIAKLQARWHAWIPDVPLVIVDSPYRSLLRPLLSYIEALHRQQPERVLTVLIPEFIAARPAEYLLHNQSALRLKGALLFRPGIVVINVPYHIT